LLPVAGLDVELGCKFYVKSLKDSSPLTEDGEVEAGDFIIKVSVVSGVETQ